MQLPFATSIDTWWTTFVLINWLNLFLAVLTSVDPFSDAGNSLTNADVVLVYSIVKI